jgi:hypothetical protein
MEHMLFIISIVVPSAGIIVHFMPLSVIEQVMWHIIGIIEATGIEPIIGADIGMDMADFMFGPGQITNDAGTITIGSERAMENRRSFRTGMNGGSLMPARPNNRTSLVQAL